MNQIIIIGGGIIGLSSAFYLQRAGCEVTIIDKSDMNDGCSYGNAGYICPSHFVPLATPGIIKQGFKWMLNSKSPFYIQPRLNKALVNWGWQFMKSATQQHVQQSAVPLRDIALLSKSLYEEWTRLPGFDFYYQPSGLIELFQTEKNAHHAAETVQQSVELGLDARLMSKEEVQQLHGNIPINMLGAIYFGCDVQVYPNKLMSDLKNWLQGKGVKYIKNTAVTGFVTDGSIIRSVQAAGSTYTADHFMLAAGSWSREIAAHLRLNLPMVGGRGYSVTLEDASYAFPMPIILSEARVAISPMGGNKLRFGGTMEITGMQTPPRMNRVQGILESVHRYYPGYTIPMPPEEKVWYGYRPCSADGLPYIGNSKRFKNITIATGHSMLGLSLGAATGKLASELALGAPTSMDVKPFDPGRFDSHES